MEHSLRTCQRCGVRYSWQRSTSSSLKMTFCGTLCEKGALGFTLDTLLTTGVRILPAEWRPLLAA